MISPEVSYVQVCEDDGAPVEIPLEDDKTLLLSTLAAQFPRATGLKYASESGSKRKVDDEEAGNFAKTKRLDGKRCTDLIVLNLPWRVEETALKNYFSRFGDVVMAQVKRDPNTNQSRGYGFIRFRDYDAQVMCLAERHFIDSRWCDVRIPISKTEGDRQEVNRKLHIGQLTEDITADMLRDHFSQFGHITDVFVPRPFRSFAFITFEDPGVAASLLGEDQVINGQTLTVGSAVPKMPAFMHHGHGGGGSGGGGHGGMMHNMYHAAAAAAAHGGPQGLPWGSWQHPFGAYGAYGDEGSGPQSPRSRYNGPSMVPGMSPSAVSTAAALASQYTRAHQNQGGGYIRQRPNGQGGGGYQGDDSTALATLNILSNPSVVAAIVNAAKNEGMAAGQGGSRGT
ncbi:TAR DNA-binding protein [Echinococcus granulosus]|uniref:TAR DNA-binding protein n=1 Tax=Echinococcus granulosus TaxID=6210 RepID=W6URP9_ECHGR|nr:TAR DNA-binding protein [Echinococcus granulosus]EUB63923.1 TAR DNA-binding protein [Echinococcus granulosus]